MTEKGLLPFANDPPESLVSEGNTVPGAVDVFMKLKYSLCEGLSGPAK